MKIKYLGTEPFVFLNGDVREEFAPGAVRETNDYIGEILLREEAVEREYNEKGIKAETRTLLFEAVVEVPKDKPAKGQPAKDKNIDGGEK